MAAGGVRKVSTISIVETSSSQGAVAKEASDDRGSTCVKDGRSLVECTPIGWIATDEAAEARKESFKVIANSLWEIALEKGQRGCAGGIDGSGRSDPSMSGIVVKDVF